VSPSWMLTVCGARPQSSLSMTMTPRRLPPTTWLFPRLRLPASLRRRPARTQHGAAARQLQTAEEYSTAYEAARATAPTTAESTSKAKKSTAQNKSGAEKSAAPTAAVGNKPIHVSRELVPAAKPSKPVAATVQRAAPPSSSTSDAAVVAHGQTSVATPEKHPVPCPKCRPGLIMLWGSASLVFAVGCFVFREASTNLLDSLRR
jgi:hypothetical protein